MDGRRPPRDRLASSDPMNSGRAIAFVSVILLLASCGSLHSGTTITGLSSDFEGEEPGSIPAVFTVAETNGAGHCGTWGVASGGAGGSGGCMRLSDVHNAGETFNLLMTKDAVIADANIEVALRADGGTEDQGGGVLWRASGSDDYYIARWNPLEDNLRVYKVQGGVRTQFATAKVVVEPGQWHTLGVTATGDRMIVVFDGKMLLDHRDTTFMGPGRVGLWTKADAATSFDDFGVTPISKR